MTGRELYEAWCAAYRLRLGYANGNKPEWGRLSEDERYAWDAAAAYARLACS